MTSASATVKKPGGGRVAVQRFGTFISGMIMPNIPAFIAWGLITTLFISVGWLGQWYPVAPLLGGFGNADEVGWTFARTMVALTEDGQPFSQYVGLVGSMITYLLPLLIANTAGRLVYGERGGVVATIATMGVIVGTSIPMFLGAMIMGPFAGWITKQMDKLWDGKIKPGFEMLVNNFSAGILGMLLAILGFFAFGPAISFVSTALGNAVDWLVSLGLLPLVSIIVEPAKVLFLNNAINQGVFTPLGIQEAAETGKSILFLLEANPGPGLGLLLAFSFFGVGVAKASAPGAILIQFFGGIHEIYFPYALAKPITILALIAGGATGVATNVLLNGGLSFPAAPGSIIAVTLAAGSPAAGGVGNLLAVYLSVVLAAVVTGVIASIMLRASRKRDLESGNAGDLSAAIAQTEANKGRSSSALAGLRETAVSNAAAEGDLLSGEGAVAADAIAHGTVVDQQVIRNVVFACDAGMGSSAMGASVLRNKMKKAGIDDVTVTNKSIANLDGSADLVITQKQLTDRARQQAPDAIHVSVDNFMNSPRYDEVVELVRDQHKDGA